MGELSRDGKSVRWADELAAELVGRQRADGSWTNGYTDAREDDPLVATPWAAAALAISRNVIAAEDGARPARCPRPKGGPVADGHR